MQAVILAAGKGTRLQPLTGTTPKPLLKICGQTILELILLNLPAEITDIIIVVGHLGGQIREQFGSSFKNKKIRYVQQKKLLGTAQALQICGRFLQGRFLVLMGDNVYYKKDIKKCLKYGRSLLVYNQEQLFSGNEVEADRKKYFLRLNKVSDKKNCLVNTGLYVLDKEFFKFSLVKISGGNEYGLPQTLAKIIADYPIKVVATDKWISVNNFDSLRKANDILKRDRTFMSKH
jgi:bifunctional UDP-N-acetylglucosamine pyrophosphorylase/glucosamine-1-phosphate N-acetyltransferase